MFKYISLVVGDFTVGKGRFVYCLNLFLVRVILFYFTINYIFFEFRTALGSCFHIEEIHFWASNNVACFPQVFMWEFRFGYNKLVS